MYPALAVLKAISKETEAILWVGSQKGIEAALVKREGVAFDSIPAAGVHGVGLKSLPGNIIHLIRGTVASLRIINRFKPDVLFFTGGYVAVPMAVAGCFKPSVLFVPDIEPGLALKVLSFFAHSIALCVEESRSFFPGYKKMQTTGYPIRPGLDQWDPASARKQFGLEPQKPVLLFFGGSLGAHSINRFVMGHLQGLLEKTQILHICGRSDWQEAQEIHDSLDKNLAARYHVFEFLHEEMGAALAAADLVISRAGASTLGEFPHFELPAILIPYPHAWRYQKVNAAYLQAHGGAWMVKDGSMEAELMPLILDLLEHPEKLKEMREKMARLNRPSAARDIAALIKQTAGKGAQS